MAISLNGQFTNAKGSAADDSSSSSSSSSMVDQQTDSALLMRMSQGDSASFEVLFHRHYRRIYGLVFRLVGNRVEAEDIVQDVFIRLHERPPADSAQPKKEHNVGAWLYRVATNTAYNAIRSRKRLWERNKVLVFDELDRPAGPEKLAEQQDDAEMVRLALAQLAPIQGQLLLLRQLGLSYTELADLCEMNPNSVGKTLARAADAFRDAFLEVTSR